MNEIRIYISLGEIYTASIKYTLSLIALNKKFKVLWLTEKNNTDIIFDHNDPKSIPINLHFYKKIYKEKIYSWNAHFISEPTIKFSNGANDYLSSIFYMVNAIQEYDVNSNMLDQFGRYQFMNSYQKFFNNATSNIVQNYINEFCKSVNVFAEYEKSHRKSTIFMTHDIDSLYGDLKLDGLWAIKKGRFDILFNIIVSTIIGNSSWENIDKIMKINDEYDIKACFFWLLNSARNAGIKNSDYSPLVANEYFSKTQINGLHKSSSGDNISHEISMFKGISPYVRYHFLKYKIPEDWHNIQDAEIQLDAGFGFYDQIGFRNSFGMPMRPFNLKQDQAFDFVLVPLSIMDGTLSHYNLVDKDNTAKKMIEFIEQNKTDAVINIIWHNHYFTNYSFKGYTEQYRKLLCYIKEENIKSITPKEILIEYDR